MGMCPLNPTLPKEGPSNSTRDCIDSIIQETRLNQLKWNKVSNEILSTERKEKFYSGFVKKSVYIELHKMPDSQDPSANKRYSLKIGNLEISDNYRPVELLGRFLFCEDYDKTSKID